VLDDYPLSLSPFYSRLPSIINYEGFLDSLFCAAFFYARLLW
jgi:hypothetical protein